MAEELKIKIKLEFKDFLNFQFGYIRKRFKTLSIIVGIIFFISLWSLIESSEGVSAFITPFLGITAFAVILISNVYYSAKKAFENDKLMQKEQQYVFNQNGLQVTNESSDSTVSWTDIYRFDDMKSNILIYTSPVKALIIPKRLLKDSDIDILNVFFKNNAISKVKSKFFTKRRIVVVSVYLIFVVVLVCVNFKPNPSNEFFEKGYRKEQQEDYEGAIVEFTKAIEAEPTLAKAYNHRGYAKGMLEDYTGEIEDCSKAINLDKKYGSAYNNMAYAKYQLGDSVGACNDLYKAVKFGYDEAKQEIDYYCK